MRIFLFVPVIFLVTNFSFALPTSEAIGSYSNGSLSNADALPLKGPGFLKLFVPRKRNFSTIELNTLLKDAAKELARLYPEGERLQIGDQSAKKGGAISGHASHQNGLDVDIAYLRKNHREQSPNATAGFDEEFVLKGSVSKNFDLERNWAALKLFSRLGELNRVFMDVEIKRALCKYAESHGELKAEAETLRALRPWPNHANHMHVRIHCPRGNSRCLAQEAPPPGPGCSASELFSSDDEF
jgi:penicillin-insensitive murein endopeptidase